MVRAYSRPVLCSTYAKFYFDAKHVAKDWIGGRMGVKFVPQMAYVTNICKPKRQIPYLVYALQAFPVYTNKISYHMAYAATGQHSILARKSSFVSIINLLVFISSSIWKAGLPSLEISNLPVL